MFTKKQKIFFSLIETFNDFDIELDEAFIYFCEFLGEMSKAQKLNIKEYTEIFHQTYCQESLFMKELIKSFIKKRYLLTLKGEKMDVDY
jgi:hypothetical protein